MDHSYFYGDFLKEVTPLTLYKLKFLNKTFNDIITFDMIKSSIIKEICRRLSAIFVNKLGVFLALWGKNGGIISSSFILQCILDEYWDGDAIDIFFKDSSHYQSTENFLISQGFKSVEEFDESKGYEEFAFAPNSDKSESSKLFKSAEGVACKMYGSKITIVKGYEKGKTKIDLISIWDQDPHNFINNLNPDICRNIFSVKYIEKPAGLNLSLEISNLNAVFNTSFEKYAEFKNRIY